MQVSHEINLKPRKLVAVIGVQGQGMFLPTDDGGNVYISSDGVVFKSLKTSPNMTLEEILDGDSHRRGVYEGDILKLEF